MSYGSINLGRWVRTIIDSLFLVVIERIRKQGCLVAITVDISSVPSILSKEPGLRSQIGHAA